MKQTAAKAPAAQPALRSQYVGKCKGQVPAVEDSCTLDILDAKVRQLLLGGYCA